GPLEGPDEVREAAQRGARPGTVADDPGLVLRVPGIGLLPEGLPCVRPRRHAQPGLRAVAAGLPRALSGLDVTVVVVRRRGLAEVPDAAGVVGGVTVERRLG